MRRGNQNGGSTVSQEDLDKIVAGNFSVKARAGAFSILFLNPPYEFDAEDNRTEFIFFQAHAILFGAKRLVPFRRAAKTNHANHLNSVQTS
jgi:hypothetical protein